jgi:hypothetical protein
VATMIVMLRKDPRTGKQNIIVKLDSDPDALPVEHEQMHKALVEKLVGAGVDAEDLGDIVIEREPAREPAEPVSQQDPPARQKSSTPQ